MVLSVSVAADGTGGMNDGAQRSRGRGTRTDGLAMDEGGERMRMKMLDEGCDGTTG